MTENSSMELIIFNNAFKYVYCSRETNLLEYFYISFLARRKTIQN